MWYKKYSSYIESFKNMLGRLIFASICRILSIHILRAVIFVY